ncbi:hypothetical protein CCO03_14355 [Comamonas serinivorans]|uniref:Acyltransferase n=1 Tax=Comamonas serinivorans TaxID=1082851 RepID=A0A1Y0EPX8_9BURK|nr:hypothetical protein [Comamonas serinivorans]ARU05707.1 hypothetical protein CCO03_14355 [Comamonas serinivorans]
MPVPLCRSASLTPSASSAPWFANAALGWVMSRNVAAGADALEADLLVFAFVHSQPIWLPGVTGALLPRHPLAWRLIRRALLLLAGLHGVALALSWWYPPYHLVGVALLLAPVACG